MANFQDLWLYRHPKAHMFYNKKRLYVKYRW